MSLRTLPILMINLGSEMVYILDQRLQAQSIREEKAKRVLSDIVSALFNRKLVAELFRGQPVYSRALMRQIFAKLAHTSIMKLNSTSMDKLFDLMTMAVKYQAQSAVSPRQILHITMNHIDGVRKIVEDDPDCNKLIDNAYQCLLSTFEKLSMGELYLIRSTLLVFFQDARVKISILLREKQQNSDGRFVISNSEAKLDHDCKLPGRITIGKVKKDFAVGGRYIEMRSEPSLEKSAVKHRGTTLGVNMYKDSSVVADVQGGDGATTANSSDGTTSGEPPADLTKEEMRLLRFLVGGQPEQKASKSNFTLQLFGNAPKTSTSGPRSRSGSRSKSKTDRKETKEVRLDGQRKTSSSVDKVAKDMQATSLEMRATEKKSRGEQMLDMMDGLDEN